MKFIETRGNDGHNPAEVSFSEAILSPMSSFGGLYSPASLPQLGAGFLQQHLNSNYKTLAKAILDLFEVDIDDSVIESALGLYDGFDDARNPVPVVKVSDSVFVSELYHGPTRAFKDMALQPFGSVLSALAQARNEKYLILAATSGDTGPAALETFKNKPNVQVVCLYPAGGTSDVQRLQMVTESAKNLKVIGIHGDFDDAQSALKSLLSSETFNAKLREKDIALSAANSVNFGRIIFQTIYHVHSYLELVRQNEIALGDKIYLNVPSGNFGNALGGFYAWEMGLPIEKILIASNQNNVLTKLINEGVYDLRDVPIQPTTSPAMDILKSSNIERVLFDLFGAERCKALMQQLDCDKHYTLTADELARLQAIFAADFCTDDEGKAFIKQTFEQGYLMDPHTATCFKALASCVTKPLKTVVYSTAEWTKFSPTLAAALFNQPGLSDLEALQLIEGASESIEIPAVIRGLFDAPVTQDRVIDKADIETEILSFLDA